MQTKRKILADNMVLHFTQGDIQSRNVLAFLMYSFTKKRNKWLFGIQKCFSYYFN